MASISLGPFTFSGPFTTADIIALENTLLTQGVNAAVAEVINFINANIPCFASGTRIRTISGDVVVENLVVGDVVVTSTGGHRLIRWLGSRTVDCSQRSQPIEVLPVRIAAHTFGYNRPSRDLRVSPGHSICIDILGEVLIPAGELINGTTVVQENVDSVTYWHVELDSHDIILAENMPAESYLDMGNRGFFAESNVIGVNAVPDASLQTRTHSDFCRPFHAGDAFVEVVRDQMRRRAQDIGWSKLETETFADLHLIADGVRIDPTLRGFTARFDVPAWASEIRLMSSAARPCDAESSNDARVLGVCIGAIVLSDGFETRTVTMEDPRLEEGFYGVERINDAALRWTTGCAHLPREMWDGIEGNFFLRVDLAGRALPRWVGPSKVSEMTTLALVA